ncbi:MAG: HD domain-containing protein, partial [Candidatus Zixiibacteriota bacterium]
MQSHPEMGARLLKGIPWLEDALEVVRHHHERWDGTGYPDHLCGDAIPLVARIFTIVDVFDALTSQRPYKEALDYPEAMLTMRSLSGKQFDPELYTRFTTIAQGLYDEVACADAMTINAHINKLVESHFHLKVTPAEISWELMAVDEVE